MLIACHQDHICALVTVKLDGPAIRAHALCQEFALPCKSVAHALSALKYEVNDEFLTYCTGALDNTRSTLHFAEQARRVAVVPTVNVTVTQAAELRRLRAANAALQKQLVSLHTCASF